MKRNAGEITSFILLFLVVFSLIYGLYNWTDRSMDYLLTLAKEVPSDFPNWASLLITIVFNGALVVFNSIVELIRIFI